MSNWIDVRITAAVFLCILCWAAPSVNATQRVALVIGNGAYQDLRPLDNPPADATAMAERLMTLGFSLVGRDGGTTFGPLLNLDEDDFSKAVRAFARRADGAEIALVYYAGHGMQIAGKPYLLPVDVPRDDLGLLQRNSIALDDLLRGLDGKAELAVAIFDACREIPELERAVAQATRASGYGASTYRGLARVQGPGRSRIVAYSGAAGQLVADGSGQHSPYTALLLAELERPDPIEDIFQRVAWTFVQRHGNQHPEVLIQGVEPDRFYFVTPSANPDRPATPIAQPPAAQPAMTPEAVERKLELTRAERGAVQQALNALGHAVGNADGVWGQRTRNGISAWQRSVGLPPSGYLGNAEYNALMAEDTVAERTRGRIFRDRLRDGGEGPDMVVMPAGRFRMGSDDGSYDEKPAHWVNISQPFAIGTTEVTFADYDHFARATDRSLPDDEGWGRDRRPVINVTWDDASAYAAWLSEQTGAEYRLPSEAEWEYAARAGTTTVYWWGDQAPVCEAGARDGAKFDDNAACDDTGTEPVASYAANPWGLYDTAGNVWEWVADHFQSRYPSEEVTDPLFVGRSASSRVARGGSWFLSARTLRSAERYRIYHRSSRDQLGFRVARTL